MLVAGCEQRAAEAKCPRAADAPQTAEAETADLPVDGVPMPRGNAARTGEQPGPGPIGQPRLYWRFGQGEEVSDPVVSDGIVYVGSEGRVSGLNARTGDRVWLLETGAGIPMPSVVNDTVYITTRDGYVYSYDTRSGRQRWQFAADNVIASAPTVLNDVVYVGTGQMQSAGSVYALDAATGQQRWRYAIPTRYDFEDGTSSALTVSNGVVYIVSSQGAMYALDGGTGERCWRSHLDLGGFKLNMAAVADGKVYIGKSEQRKGNDDLYALDAKTG